jgi:ABC-2 type transport system ATP-binding protein
LTDLEFVARSGRITGLVGRNGAGKTTALRILLGLTRADSGHASIGGRFAREFAAGDIGHLLTPGFHPGRTGRDHLRIIGALMGLGERSIADSLESVSLADAGRKAVKSYSLGMRQRLGLAAALLGEPRVLVLDEPTNGLDPDGVFWLRDELRSRAAEGATVLVSSHHLAELEQVVDDLVVIDRRVLWQGDRSQALEEAPGGTIEGLYKSLRAEIVS